MQSYLRGLLSPPEFLCALDILRQESGLSLTARNSGGACGVMQAWPCSKLALVCLAWQTDYRCDIDFFIRYVATHYGYRDSKHVWHPGTMYSAAAWKFGWRDAKGVWHRKHGIY
jgi:hypothetical protein